MYRPVLSGLPILPAWLPDESFYSLCSRVHRLGCQSISSHTTHILFGDARVGCAHDLPGGLELFVDRTAGRWGSVDELIDAHTILPYFLPLRPPAVAAQARVALASRHPGSLKFQLGLLTSRFRAHHPLKACPNCIEQDVRTHNVAYWHLTHQLPSVWVCLEHGTPLRHSALKSAGVRRFDWLLPDDCDFEEGTDSPEPTRQALLRLATDSLALAEIPPGFHFDREQLARTYSLRAASLFGQIASPTLAWRKLAMIYAQALSPLHGLSAFAGLPQSEASVERELQRLLRTPRSGTHPIRHLALIRWLFDDWAQFMAAYTAATSTPPHDSTAQNLKAAGSDPRKAALLALLREGSISITCCARRVGVDTATAMSWAAQAGIESPSRGKTLKVAQRAALIEALRRGCDKRPVAEQANVSIQTVTRVLLTTVGLHDAWLEARTLARRERHRTAWLNLAQKSPDTGIKMLRSLDPAGYAWLYRNDRSWLDAFVARLPRKLLGNHVSVRWDERDTWLSDRVMQVAAQLGEQSGRQTVTLSQLCQRIPELQTKLGALDRLPLTSKALRRLTQSRRRAIKANLI